MPQLRVAVLGATGGVGISVVRQALSAGHDVVAFVRSAAKLEAKLCAGGAQVDRARLALETVADVRDAAAVKAALDKRGPFDAVLVALGGAGIMSRDDTCSVGTRNVVAALVARQPKTRVIVCSSHGVGDSAQDVPFIIRWLLKYALEDKVVQEEVVVSAGDKVDWCLVRPTGLVDKPPRGLDKVEVRLPGSALPSSQISRTDVAAFLLREAGTDAKWLGKKPAVSW
jgi:nucleoside-diphosphate-sugar epimerase